MTRSERISTTKSNMKEELGRPKPDPAILRFLGKRAEQAMQLRFWARLGHELPKRRKFKTSLD